MTFLARSGDWVQELARLAARRLCLCRGAVSALGFAPLEFFPALLLGFAALLLLLDGADESPHPLARRVSSRAGPLPSANF